jgi:cytochrome P450
MARKYGDVVRWDLGRLVVHVVTHPDRVKYVVADNARNYPRSRFTRLVRMITGDGLVVTEGELWRRQRRLIQPAFHRTSLDSFLPLMTRATETMLDGWADYARSGAPLNVGREMVTVALRIVGEALFSLDVSAEAATIGQAVNVAMEYLNYRINHLLAPPLFVPTARNLRFRRSKTTVDKLVYDTINQRRLAGTTHHDLLGMLMGARDAETGQQMNDLEVRNEAITFLGAGHETTAMALTWTWYLLSTHPEVQRQVRGEVDQVLAGRRPELADLPQLALTRRVIEESMRMYPPVWALSKEAVADDTIGGFHIPKKSLIILVQYVTHRLPEFWPNPEAFDPDRFLPEAVAARPRFAYFPFGGGPHTCVGAEFAMQEAIVVVAMTLQRYRLDLLGGHPVLPDPIFTLRPKFGVLSTVHAR